MTTTNTKRGFALVLVLGVMVLLAILAAGIAFSVRSEMNVAGEFTDRVKARYIAHAGLQRALAELSSDNPGIDAYLETWTELRSDDEGWDFGDGIFIVRVSDETGKLNINTVNRDTLIAFFTQIVGDSVQAEEIADAIVDWRDSDDEPQLLGAESDYYLTLEQPYRAKNAPFDSPFELLLVRGVTREIFYGDPELGTPPLTELVTAYSAVPNIDERGFPRVNINTATREQLIEALGDILTEQEINAILRFRDGTQQQQSGQQPIQPPIGQSGATQPSFVRPQPGFGQQPSGQFPQQPGFQRPQQPQQTRPSQPGFQQPSPQTRPQMSSTAGTGGPSRGVPAEIFQQQQGGNRPSIPSAQTQGPSTQQPGQRPTQQGGQQQRRQIRSPLDLMRVLPTEKLIAVWERITTTDEPVLYGLVNINTAPPEVIAALLPDNPAAVEEILAYREQNGGFSSVGELLNMATLTQSELQRIVSQVCVKSGTFRIRAAGIIGDRRVVHLIDAIVERQIVQLASTEGEPVSNNQTSFTSQFVVRSWKER